LKDEKKVFFDSLFKYCINEKKQNIIFYILNQGYDIFSALQDSIECNQLNFSIALTERINENNIKKLQQKNSNGQSLLHILSIKSNSDKDLIEQLYNILVSKVNINISDYDNKGHTPLYYACLSNNFKMIELLTNKNKLNKNFLDDADKKNTPLEILYKNIKEEISEIP
jgi:ankyrin repeat protein